MIQASYLRHWIRYEGGDARAKNCRYVKVGLRGNIVFTLQYIFIFWDVNGHAFVPF